MHRLYRRHAYAVGSALTALARQRRTVPVPAGLHA
jgi:hypothetical protein